MDGNESKKFTVDLKKAVKGEDILAVDTVDR